MAEGVIRQRAVDGVTGDADATRAGEASDDKARERPHGENGAGVQALRIAAFALYFVVSCVSIHLSQLFGAWLYFYDRQWFYSWMAVTKQHFGLLIITLQNYWAPIKVRMSWDESLANEFKKTPDGRVELAFPERLVLIANHQIYTDWLYLWWIAYAAKMHGHIYIILKESLKHIPILGHGMQFFSFIFMSRKWETDQPRMAHRLSWLARKQTVTTAGGKTQEYLNPMWLLIFPEGTNISNNGRRRSAAWASKQGIADVRHALLPRSTGLQFCLQELAGTFEYVYDCTIAYDGVPRNEYAQDMFTLRGMYFQGHRPQSVDFHWRRFAVSDIPYQDPEAFSAWLLERWREKDDMIEQYLVTGRFPAGTSVADKPTPDGKAGKPQGEYLETEVKPKSRFEVVQIYLPLLALGLLVNVVFKFWRMFRGLFASQ